MKKNLYLILFTFLTIGFFISCGNNEARWFSNFDEGMKLAQKKDKAVFLLFSANDDEITERLEQNAFQNQDFLKKYSRDFVFVKLDFSDVLKVENLNPDATEEERNNAQKIIEETNASLKVAEKYSVRRIPKTLVLSKQGYVISELEFYDIKEDFNPDAENPETMPLDDIIDIDNYEKICKKFDEATLSFMEFKSNLKIANGNGKIEDRVMAIDEIFDNTDFNYCYLIKDLNEKVLEIDPENKTGSYPKHFIAKICADAIELDEDFEKSQKLFESATENKNLSPEDRQLLFFYAGDEAYKRGEKFYEEAKALYQKSIDASPESENVDFLKKTIKLIESQN